MSSPARLTILISGNGSNLQALIDASNTTSLPNTIIVRVISNRKSAKGLQRAEKALIPTYYHNLVPYSKIHPSSNISTKYSNEAREAYDADLAALVLENKPHVVVCAGWMHVLSSAFLTRLEEAAVPVINLHPALPGQFNGTKAIERAWEQGKQGILKVTGIMIHYVISRFPISALDTMFYFTPLHDQPCII